MSVDIELYERVSKIETHQEHILKSLQEIKNTQAELVGLMNQGKGMQKMLSCVFGCIGVLVGAVITFIGRAWSI